MGKFGIKILRFLKLRRVNFRGCVLLANNLFVLKISYITFWTNFRVFIFRSLVYPRIVLHIKTFPI